MNIEIVDDIIEKFQVMLLALMEEETPPGGAGAMLRIELISRLALIVDGLVAIKKDLTELP